MKHIAGLIILAVVLVSLVFFAVIYKLPEESAGSKIFNNQSLAESKKILSRLSLDQKIGQLFMIGFEEKVLTSEAEDLIKEVHPGAILLLGRNIEGEKQLKELILSLQKIALNDTGLPMFIAVDQEGGLINRIDWVEKTPESEIENKEQAYQVGFKRGEELKELGVNLNLAPLLDSVDSDDFIGERGFQKSLEETEELAGAMIDGQKESGIFTCIKHFPGYGSISFNPEEKLAVLEEVPEVSQFQEAVKSSPEMIMISNVVYNELDENLPFAFSEKSIQFLKEKIGSNILVVSDDLSQNSLLDKFSLSEIVASPFNAGADLLIFSGWRLPAIDGIAEFRKAVDDGQISKERINQSVLKIIELKQGL